MVIVDEFSQNIRCDTGNATHRHKWCVCTLMNEQGSNVTDRQTDRMHCTQCVMSGGELCSDRCRYLSDRWEGSVCLMDNGYGARSCLLLSHHLGCICHLPHLVLRMLRIALQEQNHSAHCTSLYPMLNSAAYRY